MSLKLSDLKVGDILRSMQNQALWEVTELRTGVVIARNQTHGGTTWIKTTTIQNFAKVDPKSGALSEPDRGTQSVRDHYDINGGVLAVLTLLAERQNTPEDYAKAKARGYGQPYAVSVHNMIRGCLLHPVKTLTVNQRDMIAKAVQDVQIRFQRGNDLELRDAYAAGITAGLSATAITRDAKEDVRPPTPPKRAGRWQTSS